MINACRMQFRLNKRVLHSVFTHSCDTSCAQKMCLPSAQALSDSEREEAAQQRRHVRERVDLRRPEQVVLWVSKDNIVRKS